MNGHKNMKKGLVEEPCDVLLAWFYFSLYLLLLLLFYYHYF